MHPSWKEALRPEFSKPHLRAVFNFVEKQRAISTVYPPPGEIFTAFQITPLDKVKVLILGQDPYHDEGQAHGLSFSVKPGVPIPPSLQNVYKELETDLGIKPPDHGYLMPWAEQGVFLLNSVLTVQAYKPSSHRQKGWELFTDAAIRVLNERDPMVFILWGKYAQAKQPLINGTKHTIIKSAHPSPLSATYGFFGSRPFSRTNSALVGVGRDPVEWRL